MLQSAIFDQYIAMSQKRCKIGAYCYETLIGIRTHSIEWRYFH